MIRWFCCELKSEKFQRLDKSRKFKTCYYEVVCFDFANSEFVIQVQQNLRYNTPTIFKAQVKWANENPTSSIHIQKLDLFFQFLFSIFIILHITSFLWNVS